MSPLISVLIPAYNAQHWLADAVESVLQQTWRKREIIIVDDGSTDNTLEIAQRFASTTTRVMTQPNQGAAVARNTALSICQGDYIQWLDADDLLDPEKIERQVQVLQQHPSKHTLISGAWAYFNYRKRKARFIPSALWADLTPVEWMLAKMGQNLHMQPDNWLVSRELTDAAGPWDTKLFRDNDGEYFSRIVLASDGIRFVPTAKSYYRQAGFSSISYIGGSNKKLESLFRSMQLHVQYLRSLEDSDRTRCACVTYIRTWLHEFYPYRIDLADKLQQLARDLGGVAEEPRLSWKYNWLVKFFGWGVGRRAQIMIPRLRATAKISWDKAMLRLEERTATVGSKHQPRHA